MKNMIEKEVLQNTKQKPKRHIKKVATGGMNSEGEEASQMKILIGQAKLQERVMKD